MKRKYFLAILPALLALSSCSFGPKAKENVFKEDTIAHEELFGDAEEVVELRQLQPRRAPGDLVEPKIGVQYKAYGNYYAVRYVAEIATLNVSAAWTRGVCKEADGTVTKAMGSVETTTAYAHVNNGGDIQDPSSGYSAFVVYTLYDIPKEYKDFYMVAYLTLTDDSSNTVVSKAKVTQLYEGGNSFDINRVWDADISQYKFEHTGHFLQGTIDGAPNAIVDHDTTVHDSSNNTASYKDIDLDVDDQFGSFYFANNAFEFYWFSTFFNNSLGFFDAASMAGYASPKESGQYILGVSSGDQDHIYTSVNHFDSAVTVWFKPGTNWSQASARFAIYMWGAGGNAWADLTSDTKTGIYKYTAYDSSTYPNFHFVRMDPGTTENNWDNKWNETGDLSVSQFKGVESCFKQPDDKWDGENHESLWVLYSSIPN